MDFAQILDFVVSQVHCMKFCRYNKVRNTQLKKSKKLLFSKNWKKIVFLCKIIYLKKLAMITLEYFQVWNVHKSGSIDELNGIVAQIM